MANEKRLIDANALKDALSNLEASGGHKYYRKGMDDTLHFHMPNIIDDTPTVDAVEVVHGRNETKKHPVDEFICSVCGYVCQDTHKYVYDENAEDWSMYEFEFNYCPNCGAKMDGDGNA